MDSKREGKGQLTTQKIHYVGEFKYDKFNGEGKIEFPKLGHWENEWLWEIYLYHWTNL